MSFDQHLHEHRRLVILRCLSEIASHRTNSSVLTDACNHFGVASTRGETLQDVAWLVDRGLVVLEDLTESVQLVILTARGEEVVQGEITVPGVKKPRLR